MSYKTTVDLLADAKAVPVNCRISGGELRPALVPAACGVEDTDGVIFAGYAEGCGEYFLCTQNEAFASKDNVSYKRVATLTGKLPFLFEDYDERGYARAVVIKGNEAVTCSGGTFSKINYGANLRCGVIHCGRLFGIDSTDGFKLCWSGEGGITDWEEGLYAGGSLMLDPELGEGLNVLEFGEKLIVVRKYGLTLLNMFGSPENFSADITNTRSDEIFANTAKAVCGKLLFYTVSGLRSFDGSVIREVKHRLSEDIFAPAFAVESGGKYFLSCQSLTAGGGAVLCYDAGDGESYLIDCAAQAMCVADGVYVYDEGGGYRLEEGGEYCFTCENINFGTDRDKTVTAVYVEGGGVNIEVGNGRLTRRFQDVSGLIRPKLRGKKFTVKVTGSNPVKKLTVTAEVCNAV